MGFLVRNGVNVLLCGGIGGGAQMALAQAGIRLCGGITGEADSAAAAYLAGTLVFDPRPPAPTTTTRRATAAALTACHADKGAAPQLPLRAVPLSGGTILNALRLRSGHKLRKKYL